MIILAYILYAPEFLIAYWLIKFNDLVGENTEQDVVQARCRQKEVAEIPES